MFKPHDTGSGKTHTMLGSTRQDSASYHGEAGIIPQAVADLFSQLEIVSSRNGFGEKWRMILSYIEVYNEQVYDLLESSGKVLSIREDQERGVVTIAGANEQEVNSYDEVIELLVLGNRNRRTESTNANNVSSRSHAVLQLTIQHYTRTSSGRDSVIESKLSLIDLAGSERASATNNRGVRLQEGANINKSLLSLANCINALSSYSNGSSSRKNVKYRDSKLTHLLKSSLEGNCNLVMIANVNPSHMTYEDSHNTLKYANRAKSLKVSPEVREYIRDDESWIEREAKLKEENRYLRREIAELKRLVASMRLESTELCDDDNNNDDCGDYDRLKANINKAYNSSNIISKEKKVLRNSYTEVELKSVNYFVRNRYLPKLASQTKRSTFTQQRASQLQSPQLEYLKLHSAARPTFPRNSNSTIMAVNRRLRPLRLVISNVPKVILDEKFHPCYPP